MTGENNKTVEQVYEEMEECRKEIHEKLEEGDLRMDSLHLTIESLRKDIAAILTATEELVSIYKAGKGFIRVWGWIGVGVRWLFGFGIAAGAIYAALKTGIHHK